MQVVILAGGYGTRLQEETSRIPKPLVEIGGKPIIQHIMKLYSHYGFNDFIIAGGYKCELLKDYFFNYKMKNCNFTVNTKNGHISYHNGVDNFNVTVVDTGVEALTGDRLLQIKDYLKTDSPFMLTYGDGVSDVNIQDLVEFHNTHKKPMTMTIVKPTSKFGSVELYGNNAVKSFNEKIKESSSWINAGYFVCNYNLFSLVDMRNKMIEGDPLNDLAVNNYLMSYKHEGFWQCMDTVKDRSTLEDMYKKGDTPWILT
jgi:glucose-1-phosphate cytidylyltransferase